MYHVNR